MRVCVTTEQRFERTPDGRIWALSTFRYDFWLRYLEVFDEVLVFARVQDVQSPSSTQEVSGPGLSFAPLPYYVGAKGYFLSAPRILQKMRATISPEDAMILRLPSLMSCGFDKYLRLKKRPYGVEVRGDPYDVFASDAIGVPNLPMLNVSQLAGSFFAHDLASQCFHACAAAYVTETFLQRRYPSGPNTFSTHYSSIKIGDEAYVETHKAFAPKPKGEPYVLATMGSLEQMYKAPDIFIEAVSTCIHSMDLNLKVLFMGSGKHMDEMKAYAKHKGIEKEFQFLGHLNGGDAVRAQLDKADLFVLPSRTEGLPRAMIEAMARGLPCIGTTVGGIPELIPEEDRVPVDDAPALARKIKAFLTSPERMVHTAERNLKKSREYHTDILSQRRRDMYQHVKETTLDWIRNKKTSFFS
tara:strand:+ start:6535 stop:7770 length:1236 start_codon:yes stop_codon:yes gene_type:complete